jgi:putative NIF3 family GTP cyclohydrolase 1 type 2
VEPHAPPAEPPPPAPHPPQCTVAFINVALPCHAPDRRTAHRTARRTAPPAAPLAQLPYVQLAVSDAALSGPTTARSLADAQRHAAVRTIAVQAGAGAGVLLGLDADVFVTGEMSHHDVLAATANGTSVILTAHTNSERGYLPTLKARLQAALRADPGVGEGEVPPVFVLSEVDADPLNVV